MGYHYYECTNAWSEHCGEGMPRDGKCNELEEE